MHQHCTCLYVGLYFMGEMSAKPGWGLRQVDPRDSTKGKAGVEKVYRWSVFNGKDIAQCWECPSLNVVDIRLVQGSCKQQELQ